MFQQTIGLSERHHIKIHLSLLDVLAFVFEAHTDQAFAGCCAEWMQTENLKRMVFTFCFYRFRFKI